MKNIEEMYQTITKLGKYFRQYVLLLLLLLTFILYNVDNQLPQKIYEKQYLRSDFKVVNKTSHKYI